MGEGEEGVGVEQEKARDGDAANTTAVKLKQTMKQIKNRLIPRTTQSSQARSRSITAPFPKGGC